ncbi:hypothetical protein D3C78_782540 [compost metagenome]
MRVSPLCWRVALPSRTSEAYSLIRQIRPSRTVIASLEWNTARLPLKVIAVRYWMKAVSPSTRMRSMWSRNSSWRLGMVAFT